MKKTPEKIEHNLLQTFLTQCGFLISTGYRRSSAMLAPDLWYYETMIWEMSPEHVTDKLVYSEDSGSSWSDAYEAHAALVAKAVIGEPFEET